MIFGAVDVPLLHFYPAKVLFQDVIMGLSPDKNIFVQILAVFFQVGGGEDEPEAGEEDLVEPVVLVRAVHERVHAHERVRFTFQTDSSGSWNIELDATKLTSDALPPVGSIDYVNDIFSSHRRMRHASVCVAPRTTRSTSVKCARCAWIPISNSSTKTSAMTIAAPITKWSV